MKIAVISDIHANLPALERVLEDIRKREFDEIYCTGDLVGYAPFPNEVIKLIREHRIPSVMGNYDDGIANMRLICGCDYKDEKAQALGEKSIRWTQEHTSEDNKVYLRNLPEEIRFRAGGRQVLLVHGSPQRLNEYLFENIEDDYLIKIFAKSDVDVLICGHTHKPFHKLLGSKHLINAGSVGKPKHGDSAATYAAVKLSDKVQVDIIKVPYDVEAAAKAIEESELPDEFADLIRLGRG